MVHLLPLNYLNLSHITITKINREVTDIHVRGIILGFASLFLLIKSYANWLTAELSQLCYDGVLRAVALGSTDGLSTWRVAALLVFQPNN